MFEFKKLCDSFERLSAVGKWTLLRKTSVTVLERLRCVSTVGEDPADALAGFLIGSAVSDGRLSERDYVLIYPSLLQTFGEGFDLSTVKDAVRRDAGGRISPLRYTENMRRIFSVIDDELKSDIVTLCMCVFAIDGRVAPKTKKYILRLCGT